MKKFIIFAVFIAFAVSVMGQAKINKVVSVPTATTKLGTNLFAGDRVYCIATGNEYILKANQGGTATVTTIIAGGLYTLLATSSATPTFTSVTAAGVTATTTLTLPGTTNTVVKTTGNANSVSFAHSVRATDTISSATVSGTTRLLVGTLHLTASGGKVAADSVMIKRVLVTDTLQGLVLTNSAGTRYRLRVSPTGLLTLVVVP